MHASRIHAALVASAVLSIPVAGASGQSTTSERRDLANLGGDIWNIWTSPARIQRRDLIPVGAAVGAVSITLLADSVAWVWMSHHQDAFALRMLAPLRDGWLIPLNELPTFPYFPALLGATYAAGRLSGNSELSDAGLGCTATYLAGLAFRIPAYHGLGRDRPIRSPSPFHFSVPGSRSDWYMQSFTGGHVTSAMSCASFLAHRYSLGVGEPLFYVFATGVGLGRMADGWHWASDTMVGVLSGYAIGVAVAQRQRSRALATSTSAGSTAMRPIPLFRIQLVL